MLLNLWISKLNKEPAENKQFLVKDCLLQMYFDELTSHFSICKDTLLVSLSSLSKCPRAVCQRVRSA